ncbi:MAG: EamA family transporter [Candidatus Micrarchaeia archaeon]
MLSIEVYAYSAAFLWVVVDSISKKFINRIGVKKSQLIVVFAGIIPMLLLWVASGAGIGMHHLPIMLALTVVAGFALFLGFALVYRSVNTSGISNAYVIEEIQPPLLIIFGVLALGEHLTQVQLICMLVIFLGIALITLTKGLEINKKLVPSIVGNISWALYWFFVIIAIFYYKSFVFPILLIRIFAAVFAAAYILSHEKGEARIKGNRIAKNTLYAMSLLAIGVGILDGTANLLFTVISFSNNVALAGTILSVAPVAIWLIGYFAYKEVINTKQKIGFIVATIGYIMLTFL